ncbi:hypothetical protein QBC36DRAFT_19811 [Triangularia setosa]|uniref:Uncharacterized protein n=1 Tax=Triangularia setosa TaxID=2587417 RepID=A0AAN7A9U3_9PEZI|nr:hypothetical protein QBC36DRAFT_19811 [Podospora setosa]
MGQKSSCLAHKHSASGTASTEPHRHIENGTAQDLLKDIARRSKLQTRGMPGKFSDDIVGTGSSQHATEQNGNAVDENGSTKRLMKTSTEDVDIETCFDAPVIQEVIKPHVHEIRQEEIHRDIHIHTNHTIIQPVYDLEVLPPRHFVPDGNGNLVEINESDLPGCTGQNAQWHITAGPGPVSLNSQHAFRNVVDTNARSDISSGSEHDSGSVSLTDSVVEGDEQGSQDEILKPNGQVTFLQRLATTPAKEGKTKKNSRLPKPSTPARQ